MCRSLVFLCLLLSGVSFGQSTKSTIRQISPACGKEVELHSYLGKIPVSGAVYVFHLQPGRCPRCEGGIWAIARLLKEQRQNVLLVLDVDHQSFGLNYLKTTPGIVKTNFNTIIVDTAHIFRRYIDYDASDKLGVPYL